MPRGHAQFPHERLGMVDLLLRDPAIGLGQLAHRDEYRLEENRLTMDILQGVQRTGAICPDAINKRPGK